MAKKNKDDEMQYLVRLNLANPEHVAIHQTLRNLNPDIYKSMNQFIIEALVSFINHSSSTELLSDEARRKKMGDEFVTRKELEEMENRVKEEVTKDMLSFLLSSMSKPTVVVAEPQKIEQREEVHTKPVDEDETLAELAELWTG